MGEAASLSVAQSLPCCSQITNKKVEIVQLVPKFQTLMMLWLRFVIDHKFQWPYEALNCKPYTYKVVTDEKIQYL